MCLFRIFEAVWGIVLVVFTFKWMYKNEGMIKSCIPRSLTFLLFCSVFLQKKKKKMKEQKLMAEECDSPAPKKRKAEKKSSDVNTNTDTEQIKVLDLFIT